MECPSKDGNQEMTLSSICCTTKCGYRCTHTAIFNSDYPSPEPVSSPLDKMTCPTCHPNSSSSSSSSSSSLSNQYYHVALFPLPMKGPLFPGETLHLRVSVVSALYLFSDITTDGFSSSLHSNSCWPQQQQQQQQRKISLLKYTFAVSYGADREYGSLARFKSMVSANPNSYNLHMVIIGRYKLVRKAHFHRPYPCILVSLLCDVMKPSFDSKYLSLVHCYGLNSLLNQPQQLKNQNNHINKEQKLAHVNKRIRNANTSNRGDSYSSIDCNATIQVDSGNNSLKQESDKKLLITSEQVLSLLLSLSRKSHLLKLYYYDHHFTPLPKYLFRLLDPFILISRACNLAYKAACLQPPAIDPNLLCYNLPKLNSCISHWSFWLCSILPCDTCPSILYSLLNETCSTIRLIQLIRIFNQLNSVNIELSKQQQDQTQTTSYQIPPIQPPRKRRKVTVFESNGFNYTNIGIPSSSSSSIDESREEHKYSNSNVTNTKIVHIKYKKNTTKQNEMISRYLKRNPWPCSPKNGFKSVNLRFACRGYYLHYV